MAVAEKSAGSNKAWSGKSEGTPLMHRMLISMLRHISLRVFYVFVNVFVIPVHIVAVPSAFKAMYAYFRKIRHESPLRSFWHTYVNHCLFAHVVLDRFYMFAGGRFTLDIDDIEAYRRLEEATDGFVILSAHVGCYEVAGYTLTALHKHIHALVYAGEGKTVMENRQRLLASHNINMIPISDDMSHIFAINNALAAGDIVSIPGDRIFGSSRAVECSFMGRKAQFPLGPFAVAAQRDATCLAINVMKTSYKGYKCFVREIRPEGRNIRQKAESLARAYAANLEKVVEQYPLQWYNYFDFWHLEEE